MSGWRTANESVLTIGMFLNVKMIQINITRPDGSEFPFFIPESRDEEKDAMKTDLVLGNDDLNVVPNEVWNECIVYSSPD